MEGLDNALDEFIGKYPVLRDNLMGIKFDERYPVRVKARAGVILGELDFAMQNVHNNNRASFNTEEELLLYVKAVADLMSKATTAEVFSNIAILKRLRDVDGINDNIINDLIDGLENKHRILNTIEVTTPEGAANAAMLRETIERAEEYLLYPPVPPPRTPISQPRSRRRYLPFSRQRRGTRRPSGGGRKTKQKRKRVQKNKKETKNRTRNRKSK